MPTIIALDVSFSTLRPVAHNEEQTIQQLSIQGINYFLDYLNSNSKLEFVSLIIYSMQTKVLVDFTRDYESIRLALKNIQHYETMFCKTNLEGMLQTVSNIFATTWGTQNYCQVVIFTDCGVGLGSTSIQRMVSHLKSIKNGTSLLQNTNSNNTNNSDEQRQQEQQPPDYSWLTYLKSSKLNFICIGTMKDEYFSHALEVYQQFLDISGQKGTLFLPKSQEPLNSNDNDKNGNGINIKDENGDINNNSIREIIDRLCNLNYKPFEAILKCGGYFKLECPVIIWPQPIPYISQDNLGNDLVKVISQNLEICGFLSLSDIGSPVSISRHLIVPKIESEKLLKKSDKHSTKNSSSTEHPPLPAQNEFEKLENDIMKFYAKNDDEEGKNSSQTGQYKETVCVLLHGALKVENMAALVLLNNNWYGFIYSYADSKKKSNLMLNILPPGNNVIPWLGDFRLFGTLEDAFPGENPSFPIKPEKRSYSQNCVVWIKQAALQSDIQKVLRNSKKLPEKTSQFYKELNRIRKAAISMGFIELLEGLANIFEREITVLPQTASPDCAIQLKYAAIELRKIANRDLKTIITAQPTKYNQL